MILFGYDPIAIAGMTLGIFIGGISKGVTGLALQITALAVALNFVDAHSGLALIALPLLVTNIWQSFGSGDVLTPFKRFWPITLTFVIGLCIGGQLISFLDKQMMFIIIGASAVIFAVSQYFKPPRDALGPRAEKILGPVAGAVGGVMGGLTSVWGPPIMMYMFALKLDKDLWVRSLTFMFLAGSLTLVLVFLENGILAGERIWLSAAACVPAMVGILIGERIRQYINETLFRNILLIALFGIGLNMIRRAVL